jgi:hypothetical protein
LSVHFCPRFEVGRPVPALVGVPTLKDFEVRIVDRDGFVAALSTMLNS